MKKTILVTGSSSGFGQGLVRELLRRGHTVIATLRGEETRFKKLYASEIETYAGNLLFFPLDVTEASHRDALVKFVSEKIPRLDVLVNNAGFGLMGHVEIMSEKQIRHQFEVNFFSIVLLTQRLLPALSKTKGHIIQLSSVCGQATFPHYGMYAATKHALEAFSEGLYFSKHIHGVDVTLVEPGGFKTDFATRSMGYAEDCANQGDACALRYSKEKELYANWMKKMEPSLPNPEKVIQLLANLSEGSKSRGIFSKNALRIAVGFDAKFLLLLRKILPNSVWMHAVQVFSRKIGMP